jgi:hypothetical protein
MTTTLATPATDTTARQRTLLRVDAVLCAALGLPAAIAPGSVADLLGTDASPTLVRVVGIALVLYALDLAVLSRLDARWQRPVVLAAGVGSLAWTIATVALVVAGAFSTTGAVLALVVGVLTAELGVLQLRSANR